jgi:hypothetical protein
VRAIATLSRLRESRTEPARNVVSFELAIRLDDVGLLPLNLSTVPTATAGGRVAEQDQAL